MQSAILYNLTGLAASGLAAAAIAQQTAIAYNCRACRAGQPVEFLTARRGARTDETFKESLSWRRWSLPEMPRAPPAPMIG